MAKAKTAAAKAPTPCPISKEEFTKHARAEVIKLGELGSVIASPKEFSTGSFGWNANDKVECVMNGVKVKIQVGINLTVVHSKNAS